MSASAMHPPGLRIRPYLATPAACEAARISARRLADLRHRAEPAPLRRAVWEVADV